MIYSRELKKELCEKVCISGESTLKTAEEFDIPIKTFEKWITAYNKDNHCFDPVIQTVMDVKIIKDTKKSDDNDELSYEELKHELMKKEIEIERLKKNYAVKGGGTEQKEYITFCNKNTK